MNSSEPCVVVFDGACCLCVATVRFILRRDKRHAFRFAAIDSPMGRRQYLAHHLDPKRKESLLVVRGNRGCERAEAALEIARVLGGPWRLLGLARLLPAAWRNRAYEFIARHRHRWRGPDDFRPITATEFGDRLIE